MLQLTLRPAIALVLSLMGCSTLQPAGAADLGPAGYQPQLAAVVGRFLQDYHYLHPKIDDAVSREWLDNYIDTLDYAHMVFLAADVDGFRQKYGTRLDDDLKFKTARVDAAFEIYRLYVARLAERTTAAEALLDGTFDLTNDEKFAYDREDAPFPKTADEANDLWRQRIESDVISGELAKKPRADQIAMLKKRYARVNREMAELEPADVLELYLGALSRTLDPHTTWFKPASNEDFDIDMANSLEGIGATLQTEDEYTIVKQLIVGGPADLSGLLHENDKIIAVAQQGQPPVDVIDLRIDKVVKHIRGPKGTKVALTIIPFDATDPSQTKVIEITRDKVAITSQDAQGELREIDDGHGGKMKVGVIDIPSFYLDSAARENGDPNFNSTTHDVDALLKELKAKGAAAMVIDLRDNGGGSLTEAVELTGLFVDRGPVVQIKDHAGRMETMTDPTAGVTWSGPLVVVTSEGSASASEIFAGAIQDYGRGLIVGSPSTHGKGSVQTVMDVDSPLRAMVPGLPNEDTGGALKLTTHKFYRVSGSSTQLEGVHADVVIPSPYEGLDISEKDLDHALPWDEVAEIPHPVLGNPRARAVALQAASEARVTSNQWFGWMAEDVARRKAEEADKTVSLSLAVRQAERAEAEARNKARGLGEDAVLGDAAEPNEKKSNEPPDFILDEALLVARDFVQAG